MTVQIARPPRMPIGRLRCGLRGLLRGGRDRVEADVGEEHDRRALMDAGEAVRRKRRVVVGIDVHHADADEERQREQLDHHHDVVGASRSRARRAAAAR